MLPLEVSSIYYRDNKVLPYALLSKDPEVSWQQKFPTLLDQELWLEGHGYQPSEYDGWPTAWQRQEEL